MKHITDILSGIGILIVIYLVLSNGGNAIALLNALMQSAINGIKVLQGRG